MRKKLSNCLGSLMALSSVPLRLYIVTDGPSADIARQVLVDASANASSDVLAELLHVDDMLAPLADLTSFLQPLFSPDGGYYGKKLFLMSTGIHRLFPVAVRHLILLDIDLQLRSDIALLYRHFALFPTGTIMGMAYDLQPGYRHVLQKYRRKHPGTTCGEPPPRGNPGMNSGVVLVDLEAVRNSAIYKNFLRAKVVNFLVKKYSFRNNLGDQDFYSLICWERPELFYVLPCTWNRQLCKYWRYRGYADVFDEYYRLRPIVKRVSGNSCCGYQGTREFEAMRLLMPPPENFYTGAPPIPPQHTFSLTRTILSPFFHILTSYNTSG
ncbi:hypothetical protein HPB49_025319 [Dermacentor silvarum]|uniref:Uncharacterized protein n=1 Tax=Dermacentor silvarum TaxID=543639 RepID=A0ACB8D9C1_DERSI|nr:hypothetical protein HPB49_025319 [Dermacentor silvarum]